MSAGSQHMYFALTFKAFPESELAADRLEKCDPASSSPTLAPLTVQGSRARAQARSGGWLRSWTLLG